MISTSRKLIALAWVLLLFSTAITLPYVHYHEVLHQNIQLLVKGDSSICFYSHSNSVELTPIFEQTEQLVYFTENLFSRNEFVQINYIHGNLGGRAPPLLG